MEHDGSGVILETRLEEDRLSQESALQSFRGRCGRPAGFFLGAPDEVEREVPLSGASKGKRGHDALANLVEFCQAFPAWVDATGAPLSWKHYNYGLAYLRRKRVMDEISMHNAVFMASAKDDNRRSYQSDMRMLAGY